MTALKNLDSSRRGSYCGGGGSVNNINYIKNSARVPVDARFKGQWTRVGKGRPTNNNIKPKSANCSLRSRPVSSTTRKLGITRNLHRQNCEICDKMLVKQHMWNK
jgi:hypothetical protein